MAAAPALSRASHLLGITPQDDVRAAMRANQLRLHFQRIVSLETGKASGVEALLRWEHPTGGMLPPDDFLPAIAHTPLIHDVTRWVLNAALHELRAWPDWNVSVNVTARDVIRRGFVDDVEEALDAAGIAPERLVLELTEQAMVENIDTALKVLTALRQRGVELSLDDFGTGYSSLLYLRDLPITELKIDRAFFSPLPGSDEDLAIVTSVAALGRSVGVRVVAEGIETMAQAEIARAAGCSAGQGYLWGRPAGAQDLEAQPVIMLPAPTPVRRSAQPFVLDVDLARRIHEMLDKGASLHTIAAALNSEGLRTSRKTRWTARSVALVIANMQETPPAPSSTTSRQLRRT